MLVKMSCNINNFLNSNVNHNKFQKNSSSTITGNCLDAFCFTGKIPQNGSKDKAVSIKKYRYDDPTIINKFGELPIHQAFRAKYFDKVKFTLHKASLYNNNHFKNILTTCNKDNVTLIDDIIIKKNWNMLDFVLILVNKKPELAEILKNNVFNKHKLLIHEVIHAKEEQTAITVIDSIKADSEYLLNILKTPDTFKELPLHLSIDNDLLKLSKHIIKSLNQDNNNHLEILTARDIANRSPLYMLFNLLGNNLSSKKHYDNLQQQINEKMSNSDFLPILSLKEKQKFYKFDSEIIRDSEETIQTILDIFKNSNSQLAKDDLLIVSQKLKDFNWESIDDELKSNFFNLLSCCI